jgi:hypothetical protein
MNMRREYLLVTAWRLHVDWSESFYIKGYFSIPGNENSALIHALFPGNEYGFIMSHIGWSDE